MHSHIYTLGISRHYAAVTSPIIYGPTPTVLSFSDPTGLDPPLPEGSMYLELFYILSPATYYT